MNTVTGGLVCLALSVCLAGCAEIPAAASPAHVACDTAVSVPALSRAASRLGPPSPRGLGLRHVDRAASVGGTERY